MRHSAQRDQGKLIPATMARCLRYAASIASCAMSSAYAGLASAAAKVTSDLSSRR
jgi:hypothetical protein